MKSLVLKILQIICSAGLTVFGVFAPASEKSVAAAFACAFAIAAIGIVYNMILKFKEHKVLNAELFVTAAAAGIFALGMHLQAALAMLVFLIADVVEDATIDRDIKEKNEIRKAVPQRAVVFKNGEETQIAVNELEKGNIAVVKKGDMVPSDGKLFRGSSIVDFSPVMGFDDKRKAVKGDFVPGGSINLGEDIQIEIVCPIDESFIYLSAEKLEKCINSSGESEKKFGKCAVFLKVLFITAALFVGLVPPFAFGEDYATWVYAALVLLAGASFDNSFDVIKKRIGAFVFDLRKKGIITDSPVALEQAKRADRVMAGKHFHIEKGKYIISHIKNIGCSKEELITFAAHLSCFADSELDKTIVDGFMQVARYEGVKEKDPIRRELVTSFEKIDGKGLSGYLGGRFICMGNEEMMKLLNIKELEKSDDYIFVHVACNQQYMGYIALRFDREEGAEKIYRDWADAGIKKYAIVDDEAEHVYEEICSGIASKNMVMLAEKSSYISEIEKKKNVITLKMDLQRDFKLPENFSFASLTEDAGIIAEIKNAASSCMRGCKIKSICIMSAKAIFFSVTAVFGLPLWIALACERAVKIVLSIKP